MPTKIHLHKVIKAAMEIADLHAAERSLQVYIWAPRSSTICLIVRM